MPRPSTAAPPARLAASASPSLVLTCSGADGGANPTVDRVLAQARAARPTGSSPGTGRPRPPSASRPAACVACGLLGSLTLLERIAPAPPPPGPAGRLPEAAQGPDGGRQARPRQGARPLRAEPEPGVARGPGGGQAVGTPDGRPRTRHDPGLPGRVRPAPAERRHPPADRGDGPPARPARHPPRRRPRPEHPGRRLGARDRRGARPAHGGRGDGDPRAGRLRRPDGPGREARSAASNGSGPRRSTRSAWPSPPSPRPPRPARSPTPTTRPTAARPRRHRPGPRTRSGSTSPTPSPARWSTTTTCTTSDADRRGRVRTPLHCPCFSAYPDAESQLSRTVRPIRRRRWAVDDLSRFCCLNSRVPRSRHSGAGKPLRLRPLRQGRLRSASSAVAPAAIGSPNARAPPVPLASDQGEGHGRPGAHRRGVRRPPDRAARGGPPRHRDPLHPQGRRACRGGPRRVGRPFPPDDRGPAR